MAGPHLAVLAIASSALSAYAGIQAAKAQKAQYDAQANLVEKQGRMQALQYKQQGVQVLKEMNKALAATTARAGAGNLDPFSSGDTPDIVMGYTMRAGVNDFTIARDQASITEKYSKYQAASYRVAGQSAVKTAKISAIAQIGMGVASAGYLYGTPGFTGGATTTASTSMAPTTVGAPLSPQYMPGGAPTTAIV
jgi:hypothetical protein